MPDAVGRTHLRVGEGIIGLVAATNHDAQPARCAVPPRLRLPSGNRRRSRIPPCWRCRCGGRGRTLGVLAVQNRATRARYDTDEVEGLETVAMLLAEVAWPPPAAATLRGGGAGCQRCRAGSMRQRAGRPAVAFGHRGAAMAAIWCTPRRVLAEDPCRRTADRLDEAVGAMRQGDRRADLRERSCRLGRRTPRNPRMPTRLGRRRRRVAAPGVRSDSRRPQSAEAAVHRVARRVARPACAGSTDPYLRERLADLEDLGRCACLPLSTGDVPTNRRSRGGGRDPGRRGRLGPAELLDWHARGIGGVVIEEGSAGGACRDPRACARALPCIGRGTRRARHGREIPAT